MLKGFYTLRQPKAGVYAPSCKLLLGAGFSQTFRRVALSAPLQTSGSAPIEVPNLHWQRLVSLAWHRHAYCRIQPYPGGRGHTFACYVGDLLPISISSLSFLQKVFIFWLMLAALPLPGSAILRKWMTPRSSCLPVYRGYLV